MTNIDGANADVAGLRAYYSGDANARSAFDLLSRRKYFKKFTTVEFMMRSGGLSRTQAVFFFKRLEEFGCGEFLAGRHDHKSRFEWSFNLGNVARAASGRDEGVGEPVVGESDEETDEDTGPGEGTDNPQTPMTPDTQQALMRVGFPLRLGYELKLEVPIDLTAAEAERLAGFVRALPFR